MSEPVESVEVRLGFVVTGCGVVREAADKLRETWAIEFLRGRGFHIAPPRDEWETPKQFIERLGVHYETFSRALRRDGCPNVALRRTRNGAGRIAEVRSNDDFDAFVRRYKDAHS